MQLALNNTVLFAYQFLLYSAMIPSPLLLCMLSTLAVQELREIYGLMRLEAPWVAVELAIHAMVFRKSMQFEGCPRELQCVEFFAGTMLSSQIAKGFAELGCSAIAFDVLRHLGAKCFSGKEI